MPLPCQPSHAPLLDASTRHQTKRQLIREVLLSGINDIDIRREALSTPNMQQKTINELISFVEGRVMARNATPAASVSALKRTYTPKPQTPLPTERQKNCPVPKLQQNIPPFQRNVKRHLEHQTPQTMFRMLAFHHNQTP